MKPVFILVLLILVFKAPFVFGYDLDSTQNAAYFNQNETVLDKEVWKQKASLLKFDEDTVPKKKSTVKPKLKTSIDFTSFKYVFYFIAFGIIMGILYLIFKHYPHKNVKNNPSFIYNNIAPEKEELLNLQIVDLYNKALNRKDFALAYRLKYLNVLKELVLKNIIYYKKHHTNYELMLQIKPKEIQDLFKKLTYNFDGIWYGELHLNEQNFNELISYFTKLELLIKAYK